MASLIKKVTWLRQSTTHAYGQMWEPNKSHGGILTPKH